MASRIDEVQLAATSRGGAGSQVPQQASAAQSGLAGRIEPIFYIALCFPRAAGRPAGARGAVRAWNALEPDYEPSTRTPSATKWGISNRHFWGEFIRRGHVLAEMRGSPAAAAALFIWTLSTEIGRGESSRPLPPQW